MIYDDSHYEIKKYNVTSFFTRFFIVKLNVLNISIPSLPDKVHGTL